MTIINKFVKKLIFCTRVNLVLKSLIRFIASYLLFGFTFRRNFELKVELTKPVTSVQVEALTELSNFINSKVNQSNIYQDTPFSFMVILVLYWKGKQ